MKFLHTADWQMGMQAPEGAEAKAQQIREARFQAARNVVETARVEQVDFLCVAGDLFEHNAVDPILVRRVADLLSQAPCPVYILPGNHDPLVPGSVWEHPVWAEHANLHVLREARPEDVPGGRLFPCPVTRPHSREDPTAWIHAETEEAVCVGVAHGNVETSKAPELVVARDAPERTGLDYLALGHWHSLATWQDGHGACRLAYSGTHEPTNFGERDPGKVLVVEIPHRHAAPVLRPVETAVLSWLTVHRTVREGADLERIFQELSAIPQPETSLVSLVLEGVFPPEGLSALQRIEEVLATRFLLGRLDTGALSELPEDERWIEELEDPVAQATARTLLEQARRGLDRDTALAALRELLDAVRSVSR